MLKRRVERLERTFRGAKSGSDGIAIVIKEKSPDHEGKMNVKVNGEIRFTGIPEECDRWIDESLGPGDLRIVIGGNRNHPPEGKEC